MSTTCINNAKKVEMYDKLCKKYQLSEPFQEALADLMLDWRVSWGEPSLDSITYHYECMDMDKEEEAPRWKKTA